MDTLKINGIEVECVLGDLPEERTREQKIQVDVSLELDLEAASASDSIDDTVDYALLVGRHRGGRLPGGAARGARGRHRPQVRQRAGRGQRRRHARASA